MSKEMLKKKMKSANTSSSATKSRTPAEKKETSEGKQILSSPSPSIQDPPLKDGSKVTAAGTSPPSMHERKRARLNQGSPAMDQPRFNAEAENRRLQEEANAWLREQGLLPFMQEEANARLREKRRKLL